MSNTLDGAMMDGETVTIELNAKADAAGVAEGDNELSPQEVAALAALCDKHGITLEHVLASRQKQRRSRDGSRPLSVDMDHVSSTAAPSLSPRKVIVQVRQRQAVPLHVDPISDEEWQVLSPHMFCRSRTLAKREMLYRALRFACGHAQSKTAYDCSMAAWASYEVTRYHGTRIRAMVEAARGQVSDQRQRELEALAQYAEQRAAGRARFED